MLGGFLRVADTEADKGNQGKTKRRKNKYLFSYITHVS